MQYHVGDKVRIKDTCRIDSLRAGDIVTIDWVGVDLNNIVLYTVREDPTGNLLDEYDIEPYNIGWVCRGKCSMGADVLLPERRY